LQASLCAALSGAGSANFRAGDDGTSSTTSDLSWLVEPGSAVSLSTMAPSTASSEDGGDRGDAALAKQRSWSSNQEDPGQHSDYTQSQIIFAAAMPSQVFPAFSAPLQMVAPVQAQQAKKLSNNVPKTINLAEEFAKNGNDEQPTTMMIRNIPYSYTQSQLIIELGELGFADSFDFLYLPMDKSTATSISYAFVNFVDPSWASKCQSLIEGYTFKHQRVGCCKIATVSVAHIQGLAKNLAHYENTEVRVAKWKQRRPMVFAGKGSGKGRGGRVSGQA
jgi:hypothetical protein